MIARTQANPDIPACSLSLISAQARADAIVDWTNRDGMRTPDHGVAWKSLEPVWKSLEMVWKPLEMVLECLELVWECLELVWESLEMA